MKYSSNFIRDINFYLKHRHKFNFDGCIDSGYVKKEILIYRDSHDNKFELINQMSLRSFEEAFGKNLDIQHEGLFHRYILRPQNEPLIVYDKNGVDGVQAFWSIDSKGIVLPTKHKNLLKCLLKTKGSVNLHIQMYAEDLAKGNWNKIELRALCIKLKAPDWFRKAIENQRWGYIEDEEAITFIVYPKIRLIEVWKKLFKI